MASPAETAVPLERIAVNRRAAATVAVVGNPNAGKSSVFNRLTGLRQHTANYPGVTVERRIGRGNFGGVSLDLIDLPGTYSLSPTSTDEKIAVDVLFGRVVGTPKPEAILAVIDSTPLASSAFLRACPPSESRLLPEIPLPRLTPPLTMPPLRELAPTPKSPFSSTTASMPPRRSSSAVDSPP